MGRYRTQLTMQKKRSDENKYNLAQLNRRTNYFVSAQVAFSLFSIVRLYRSCCCTNLGDIFQRVVVAFRLFCPLVVFFCTNFCTKYILVRDCQTLVWFLNNFFLSKEIFIQQIFESDKGSISLVTPT